MSAFTVRLIVCAPIDPSGKAANAPFEADILGALSSLMVETPFVLSGSGTTTIPLGQIPAAGLRGFVLMLDPIGAPASISVAWTNVDTTTGGVKEITAASGTPGLLAIFNAVPVNGIVVITVTHSTGATLRMVAIG